MIIHQMTLVSAGKFTAISPKSPMISSKCFPTTPRHRLSKLGGFVFSIGDPAINKLNIKLITVPTQSL